MKEKAVNENLFEQMVSDEVQLKLLSCQRPEYPSQLREIDRECLCALQNVHQVLAHVVLAIHILAIVNGCEEKFAVLRQLDDDNKRLDVIDQCLLALKCS